MIAPALEVLRQARDGNALEKDPRKANDARLRAALEECLAARALVSQKCTELHELAATKEKAIERDYLLYLADVIPLQINRAAEAAEMRLAYLRELKSKAAREAELARCADGVSGTLHWFKYWAWSQDPRPVAPLAVTPFAPFEFQDELIAWLDRLVFLERKSGLLDKSRDMGASWVAVDWAVKHWRFFPGFKALFGSRVEDLVDDKKNTDSLLEKVRFQIRLLPSWMLPTGFDYRGHTGYMNIVNPELDCLLTGEAPTPDFGRQGRYTTAIMDEHAAWPHGGFPQWTASSQSTPCKISISTPKGKLTKQAELRFNSEVEVLSLNWRRHPWKDERWYKGQTVEMSAAEIAQEIDLDYEGSQAGRLLPMWDERIHVITWSEFAEYFGQQARDEQGRPRIPQRWGRGMAHDVGTTQEHPAVILWAATAAEDSRAPGYIFLYRELCLGEGAHPGILAPLIKGVMDPQNEWRTLLLSLISHEGNAERLLYEHEYGIHFTAWDTEQGYTQGYPQLQSYLEPDKQVPHLFRPWLRDKEGVPVGCPRLFVIVADEQGGLVPDIVNSEVVGWKSKPAQDSDGFARLRMELPAIHIPQSEMGKPARARRHFKKLDDAFDCARALAAQFFPATRELSEAQRLDAKLPAHFQRANLQKTFQEHGVQAFYSYQAAVAQAQAEDEESGAPRWGVAGRMARRGNGYATIRDVRQRNQEDPSPLNWRDDDDD